MPAHSLIRYFYSLVFIFNGVHELTPFGSAILTESPIWFATTLPAGFGQTGFAPAVSHHLISKTLLCLVPKISAYEIVSRPADAVASHVYPPHQPHASA